MLEWVDEANLRSFFDRAVATESRVLPFRPQVAQQERELREVTAACKEEYLPDFGLAGPRTVGWCLQHLSREGRGFESHHELFKQLCGLQANQWGIEEHFNAASVLRAMAVMDQLDVTNLVSAELIARHMHTIEYSYSDRLREKTNQASSSRLSPEEQAALGGAARLESRLMICPALLEHAKADLEREAGLAKTLVKAREARASLAKKS